MVHALVAFPYFRVSLFSTPGCTVSEATLSSFMMEATDVPLSKMFPLCLNVNRAVIKPQSLVT